MFRHGWLPVERWHCTLLSGVASLPVSSGTIVALSIIWLEFGVIPSKEDDVCSSIPGCCALAHSLCFYVSLSILGTYVRTYCQPSCTVTC
ncbi:hypothetical protein QBC32DRAFT_332885 [Pseudoneurospora amorphoporcata]|uniref:Uncharacterized protein n=1 Tax=Pseudoneurospora amorphoporcata TaxID=241081 RepID=A0AAN6P2W4_9PEZI|nr:hypothetical protein QBC32DRAFT_332885 [Pseudoneurospora amorphoporcata]